MVKRSELLSITKYFEATSDTSDTSVLLLASLCQQFFILLVGSENFGVKEN